MFNKKKMSFALSVCDFPPDIGNGTYTQSRGNSNGSVTTYACNPGWYLNGTATVTCWDNGLWVGDIPNCFGKTLKPFYVSYKYAICTSLFIENKTDLYLIQTFVYFIYL